MECRTCLKTTNEFQDLFAEDCDVLDKIETISSIQILANEHFPANICRSCVTNIELLYDFCEVVRRSNMILENRICDDTGKGESVKHIEDDLIEIDEIKLESETENMDVKDSIDTNERAPEDLKRSIRKSKPKHERKIFKSKIYDCPQCDFTTQNYRLIINHRNKHKSRSICSICGKAVTTYNLSKHLTNHNDSPKTCEVCGKVFKNRDTLRIHMYLHKVVKLQCTYCEKICHSSQSYYRHLQRHKYGDVGNLKCPMCEKRFNEKKDLQKHIRSHTGERPYPCEYCKKGFSSSHALKTHIRQHTKEKPFACDFCDMAFPQRISLRTHLKSKHPDKTLEQAG